MPAEDLPEPHSEPPPPTHTDSFPEQIHRYRVLEELGRGSMGRVFLAEDPNIGRRLALKVLAPQHLAQGEQERELQQRFLYEGRAAGCLDHPGIVTVYDADTDPASGLPYLAMEYVEGRSLRQLLDASKPPTPRELLRLLVQVAQALDYAHRQDVVHRDIKPANLLVTQQGHVKVVDFGIAKMVSPAITLPGRTVGTPFYMSPEQVRGHQVDGRCDLFSLGVVLYECITGQVPFAKGDISNIQYAIVHRRHPPARRRVRHLDRRLARIVDRALAKEPSQRFQRGEAFASALDALVFDPEATLWIAADSQTGTSEPMVWEDFEDAFGDDLDGDLSDLESPSGAEDTQGPTEPATPHRPRRPLLDRRRRRRSPTAQRRDRWIAGVLFALILGILYLRHFDLPILKPSDEPALRPPNLSGIHAPGETTETTPPGSTTPSDEAAVPGASGPGASGPEASGPTDDASTAPPADSTVASSLPQPAADGTAGSSMPATSAEETQGTAVLRVQFRNFLAQAYISLWVDGERQFTESVEAGFWRRNFASGEDFQRRVEVLEGRRSVEVHVSKIQGRKVESRGMVYATFEAGKARTLQVRLDPGSDRLTLSWQEVSP